MSWATNTNRYRRFKRSYVNSSIERAQDLSNAGAHVVDESVVVDNNIVTSRVPDDLDDFNREIVKQLQ